MIFGISPNSKYCGLEIFTNERTIKNDFRIFKIELIIFIFTERGRHEMAIRHLLYFNTDFLRPMVKDLRNPGACVVLLLRWVAPLWSLDGPERFLLFQICAFTVYFCKRVWLPMAMTSVCSQSRSHQ